MMKDLTISEAAARCGIQFTMNVFHVVLQMAVI